MKICLVAPGEIEIPPKGWGALETIVWNQYLQLKNLGYDVTIINENDTNKTYQEIQNLDPDIVHLNYGKHFEILPFIHKRKIITNYDGSFLYSHKFHEQVIRQFMYDCEFFIITSWEKKLLQDIGLPKNNIKILPSGVDYNIFRKSNHPKYNKSLCLGKIDARKNQKFLQQLNIDIVFVGQNADATFNVFDSNYLGPWDRNQVTQNLTDYSNLVLLSNSELQPLVCSEAMSAGLGLVISEQASQNLDTSLDFIEVIPNNKINDIEYVKSAIINNRNLCNNIDRNIILEYAKTFDWSEIIKKYVSYL